MAFFATLAAVVSCVFTGAASAAPEFELVDSFGPDGTSGGSFSEAGSVAVDQVDDIVYVLDRTGDALYKFDLEGNPVPFGGTNPDIEGNKLSKLAIQGARGGRQVAVDSASHTIYLTGENVPPPSTTGTTALQAFESNGDPSIFTAGPGIGTNEISGFSGLRGVAVDQMGNIYAAERGGLSAGITVYDKSGALVVPKFGASGPANISVDAEGVLYVVELGNLEKPGSFIPSGYPLTPSATYVRDEGKPVDPKATKSVVVDPVTDRLFAVEEFVSAGSAVRQVAVFDADRVREATFAGTGEPDQLQRPDGIAVGGGGEKIFVVDSPEGGLSQVKVFKEKLCEDCPPKIESTNAISVTGDSAVLRASINPSGRETTYWFEYGPDDCAVAVELCAKLPLNGLSIGDGRKDVTVTKTVPGLEPQTKYFYRVVAESENGSEASLSKTITTHGSGLGFSLSDSRLWEMVTPPNKYGGRPVLPGAGILQAAEDGDGLAYLTLGSIETAPEGNRAVAQSSAIASRGSEGSWISKDITPPHVKAGGFPESEYRLMSPDLGRALLVAQDDAPLSPLTTERTPYLRDNTEPPAYTPLLTSKQGFANVPAGTKFGSGGVVPVGANRDLTQVVLKSTVPLMAGAPAESLYLWSAAQLRPLSQLPGEGGAMVAGVLGSGLGSIRNAMAQDGSRVFWAPGQYTGTSISLSALYLRDIAAEESVRLDVPESGAGGGGPPVPAFEGASVDGTVVFFTDSRHLVKGASPEGRDLYRCEIPTGDSLGGCATLTDLSAPPAGSGENAKVRHQVVALGEDGSRIYFIADGVLDGTPNQGGDAASAGQPNLYVWQEGEATRFIATLSEEDSAGWGVAGAGAFGIARTNLADASPDGRFLAFMSELSLTGYDNSDPLSGQPIQEAFRYDAVSEELVCVSCNPTGASPQAHRLGSEKEMVNSMELLPNRLAAALLPGPRGEEIDRTYYHPRAVLDNGRVFFNAYGPLVPGDSNGEWDVYQYESTGVGSCTASSSGAAFSRLGEGCVSLISSGTAGEEAAFLDASASGDDVFFLSAARLSVLDPDEVYDVYDARVDGVAAQLPSRAECQGEACQPPAFAPDDPTPASSSFEGGGNVKAHQDCDVLARRVGLLRRRARALRRQARTLGNSRDAGPLKRRATRLSRRADALARKEKRCRRANRRAER